jgi:hypothetical protein
MWFYLFSRDKKDPDPLVEIRALAELDERGEAAFLRLSSGDEALLKDATEGEVVYLCTRDQGRWSVYGESVVIGCTVRGGTPASMSPVYGETDGRHWWRRLAHIRLYPAPKGEADLGLVEGTLREAGQSHVIHLPAPGKASELGEGPQPGSSPLTRLTEVMDAAWEEGRLSPEAVEGAIRDFRKAHPYGR